MPVTLKLVQGHQGNLLTPDFNAHYRCSRESLILIQLSKLHQAIFWTSHSAKRVDHLMVLTHFHHSQIELVQGHLSILPTANSDAHGF